MRCISCDAVLNEFESTRRAVSSNDFLDMCSRCFSDIDEDVEVIDRLDLKHESDNIHYGVEELNFSTLTFTNDFSEDYD
jgi:hypothetical protein